MGAGKQAGLYGAVMYRTGVSRQRLGSSGTFGTLQKIKALRSRDDDWGRW